MTHNVSKQTNADKQVQCISTRDKSITCTQDTTQTKTLIQYLTHIEDTSYDSVDQLEQP